MSFLPTIVFVDDEERILRSLRMLFRGRAEVLATTSGRQAIEWVRSRRVHVVVSDQRMPGMGGVEVLREVAHHSPNTMRMLLTGYADLDAVTASVNEGEIYRFVEKPWDGQQLLAALSKRRRLPRMISWRSWPCTRNHRGPQRQSLRRRFWCWIRSRTWPRWCARPCRHRST